MMILLCIKTQKQWKQIRAVCGILPEMNETPFKIFFFFFGQMRLASIQQLEDLGVVNYIGFHVWTLALGGIYHGDKFDIFTWQW